MITLVEALNYRCLRWVSRPLGPLHVLVGPNASGKTTFLDAIGLLGELMTNEVDTVLRDKASHFQELLFNRGGDSFAVALEARIPEEKRQLLAKPEYDTVRYEIEIGLNADGEVGIRGEKLLLKKDVPRHLARTEIFPRELVQPKSLLTARKPGTKLVINKSPAGNDNFYSETYRESGKGWVPSFKLGPKRSALGNLPADETKFPVATWFRQFLTRGVQRFVLNSQIIRKASPPNGQSFKPDGSNLPWLIEQLRKTPTRYRAWLEHLRSALPDLKNIRTVERKDDRHRYAVLCYANGLEVPSWLASDGTLRLLALTLPAYLVNFSGVFLIEEPENGIHPRAISTVYQSLSSMYQAQVLVATHSPMILGMADPADVLCFARDRKGATDILSGKEHPRLRDWKREVDLGTLLAGGVLG